MQFNIKKDLLFIMLFLGVFSFSLHAQEAKTDSCKLKTDVTIGHLSCKGGDDGNIDLTVFNANSPEYSWSNGETTEDIYSLNAGSYSVTISDDNCNATANFVVKEPNKDLYIEVVQQDNITCPGAGDGSFEVKAIGGTEPYEFRFANEEFYKSETIYSGADVGIYQVEVRDTEGCIASIEIEIMESEVFQLDLGGDVSIHSGETVLFDAGEGYEDYLWSTGDITQSILFTREVEIETSESVSVDVVSPQGCIISSNVISVTILPEIQDPQEKEVELDE